MRQPKGIFRKLRLTPGQLRAVAEKRYEDAQCLLKSDQSARANGAMYMGGFVIECLLKAMLLERHPNLQQPVDPAKLSKPDLEVHRLLYSHDLDAMLEFLPEVETKLGAMQSTKGTPVLTRFRAICEEWTVYARYSPKHATIEGDARPFLETIREVKTWLKRL